MEQIGALRYAAEAAANAADAFARDGRQDSARRAAARSRELHPRGQGGPAPAITELDPDSVKLTQREAQLVKLASEGLSNPEIADRLVLSVRTIESHLYRAMQKLGVNDRRDLR
jgi:DNA-binding NarL/FixJ family response regulator